MSRSALAAVIAGAVVLAARGARAQGGASGSVRPRRWRAPRVALPEDYARDRDVLARVTRRADDAALRASFARWGARWMPGAPLSAVIAVSVTSTGPRERLPPGTDEATGIVNVEAARARRLGADATTAADLGRSVDPDDRDAWIRDVDGQVYVGLRGYAEELRDLASRAASVRASPSPWTVWDYALAVAAYSGGPSAAGDFVAVADEDLSRAEAGAERWRALVGELAELDGAATTDSARHVAWGAIRAAQRLAVARALARARPVTDQIPGWGGTLAPAGAAPLRVEITDAWCGEDPGAATWARVRDVAYGVAPRAP